MNTVIELSVKTDARPTKEVLGEHLHHKVSQLISQYGFKSELQIEDRVTGMLLELPDAQLTYMLTHDVVLRSNVKRALQALVRVLPELEGTAAEFEEQIRSSLTSDDIGVMLYDCVVKMEPELAPKITGMLLELDAPTLLSLLDDSDTMLRPAVQKAKKALEFSVQQEGHSPRPFPTQNCDAQMEDCLNQSSKENHDIDDDLSRERFGALIYEEAAKVHPECAANVTGMLLELSLPSLTALVNDKSMLAEAMEKSYQAWRDSVT